QPRPKPFEDLTEAAQTRPGPRIRDRRGAERAQIAEDQPVGRSIATEVLLDVEPRLERGVARLAARPPHATRWRRHERPVALRGGRRRGAPTARCTGRWAPAPACRRRVRSLPARTSSSGAAAAAARAAPD